MATQTLSEFNIRKKKKKLTLKKCFMKVQFMPFKKSLNSFNVR